MANHPSADKRNRQRLVRTERNRAVKSSVRTLVKKARTSLEQPNATELVVEAARALDMAVSKGVLHKRTAARRKSRLMHAASAAKAPKA